MPWWPWPGRLLLVSVGKAGWSMARAAWESLGERVDGGIVITKHGHAQGPIGPLTLREDLRDVTRQLLASGADIVEMNTVRKCLCGGKGGGSRSTVPLPGGWRWFSPTLLGILWT